MSAERFPVAVGDIVQLDPEQTGNPAFAACLLTVTEVKAWGVQGYVQALGETREAMGGQAYYRAAWGTFAATGGRAVWTAGELEDDGQPALLAVEEPGEKSAMRRGL